MKGRPSPFFLLAIAFTYVLPQLSLPLIHLAFESSSSESPYICPGCFLNTQNLFDKLPDFILPFFQPLRETSDSVQDQGSDFFINPAVKLGGNKSPPHC